jgi:hypothetical protein
MLLLLEQKSYSLLQAAARALKETNSD